MPTELLPPGSPAHWPDTEFVMKPAVGVGSIGAARFAAAAKDEARSHLDVLHDAGHAVLLQPYQSAVDSEGETALVFFAGLLRLSRTDLLYARVDLVRADDGGPALLELELTEPSLGFAYADAGAALRFASAVPPRLS